MALFSHFRITHFMIFAIVVLTIFLYSLIYTANPDDMSTMIHAGSAHHLIGSSSSISNSLVSRRSDTSNSNNNNNNIVSSSSNSNSNDDDIEERFNVEPPSPSSGVYNEDAVIRQQNGMVEGDYSNPLDVRIETLKDGSGVVNKNAYSIADKTLKSAVNTTQVTVTASTPANANKTKSNNNETTTPTVLKTSDIYESGFTESCADLCKNSGEQLRLMILITSAPTHHDMRLAIRQSWGHFASRRDIAIGFILGQTNNQTLEDGLAAENFMYNDLVRGRFLDSYNNLTLKTISSLEWVETYCPNASFFLKTDDDMFINVPRLLQFIELHHKDKRSIYGRLAKKWKPIRNKKSKYYVSPQQYFPSIFPQFVTGPAYLITNDAISDLYRKALEQTYLKLEDVYTTGIVAQLLNIKRIHVTEFLNRRIAFNQCNIKKAVSLHMIKPNEQFDLWKKLLDNNVKCK